ncbi:hypothetical protein [Bradyrhizobium sp. Ec3.3]|uniref:hypothetical protein n=1 Tax=Bradyrhizobium sp. Ec3.3 TaxID=189753 RepID=UPI001FD95731|nr:hypothetical protein [Bradyrhizobium sp. Ec3.3]
MVYELCLTTGKQVPSDWNHEVKYDGYGMLVIRDDKRVRPLSPQRRRLDQALSGRTEPAKAFRH